MTAILSRLAPVVALALVMLATPALAEEPPPAKIPRVGYLTLAPEAAGARLFEAFRLGLRELGLVEGQHLAIERRSAEGKPGQLPALAAELARLPVDVIVAGGLPAAEAAQQATRTIPIVMVGVDDPVGRGLIASRERPGGNVTGMTGFSGVRGRKQLELLKEVLPRVGRVGVFFRADWPHHAAEVKETQAAGKAMGVEVLPVEVGGAGEVDAAFVQLAQARAEALIVFPRVRSVETRIAELAVKHRLPAVHGRRLKGPASPLLSYTPMLPDVYRRAARYVDKIVKGAKAGELPVEAPSRFELVVNLKTAQALGLTIPQSVLDRADEVVRVSASGGGQEKPLTPASKESASSSAWPAGFVIGVLPMKSPAASAPRSSALDNGDRLG